ncbi:hypothetical protein, conserved in T. vivax [Trypanosoma vivax Y486]|uniref:Uncharacterized protein n=1 Tax=Trypanosoma vivax (strain Y486) TaxID=1055687 RepID=F9WTH7_TRYVY|nr:hypothetical protein, conserved in T. vivax [Trypanosoma vivax Y486]|eukprot:CCD20870.1 hypothetical protein, conserved in T. vivax [Trypanosoma vivax Y486]
MQRLFCTCAFLLAAASVAALAADPGPGSPAAEFAVLCGDYREAKAVKDSAEQMRDGIESFVAVGREGHVVEETGGQGSGDGIGTQPSVGSARTRSPRAVADDLAKMAESYAMQEIYGSKKEGTGQQLPVAEAATNKLLTIVRGSTTTAKGFDEDGNEAGLILPMILLCKDGTSSSAYACACFDKADAANRGQGIKFINHLITFANALRRLQRLRDDVTRHKATVTAIEKHKLSTQERRADTGNAGKINTSARAGKGEQEQQTNVAAGKGAAATTESACEKMGGQWDAHRQACSAAQQEKRRTPPVKRGGTPRKRTSQATWEQ